MADNATPQALTITDNSYPALYAITNQAAVMAQRRYMQLVAADLIFLMIGAFLSALSLCYVLPTVQTANAIAMGTTFGLSLCLTIVLKTKQYEKIWYGSRAVAESVRTMAWRYMTCTEPFTPDLSPSAADTHFARSISALILERRRATWLIGAEQSLSREITEEMRAVRQMDTVARRQHYVKYRAEDQMTWYGRKAKLCQKREDMWFMFIIIAQFLALVSSIIYAVWLPPLNIISFFAALATALFSWVQVKQYKELGQSYGLTAQQLGVLLATTLHINTEEALTAFVKDAEGIMGREHELWIIRHE